MQNTSSVVKPINTLCLEGPVINVVASNQVLYAYYFGVCIEIFINTKYFKCCTCLTTRFSTKFLMIIIELLNTLAVSDVL